VPIAHSSRPLLGLEYLVTSFDAARGPNAPLDRVQGLTKALGLIPLSLVVHRTKTAGLVSPFTPLYRATLRSIESLTHPPILGWT